MGNGTRIPLIPWTTYCDFSEFYKTYTYRCHLDAKWHERTALFTWQEIEEGNVSGTYLGGYRGRKNTIGSLYGFEKMFKIFVVASDNHKISLQMEIFMIFHEIFHLKSIKISKIFRRGLSAPQPPNNSCQRDQKILPKNCPLKMQ